MLLVAAIVLSACGGVMTEPTTAPPTEVPEPTQAPSPAEEITVNIVDSSFTHSTITVPVGTTVIWTHNGQYPHTVTLDDGSFDSDSLSSGDTYIYTFDQAGTYTYYCKFHGGPGGVGMSGTIIVTEE
jgi:plastocyanin